MIVSLLYEVTRKLLSIPLALLRGEAVKDAELLVLRHEDTVLRRQLAGPIRYEPAGRLWFAALSRLIHRWRWREVFPVSPARLLGRHRRLHRLGDPERGRHRPGTTSLRPTWRKFLTAQAEGIIATDFFHIDTALGTRLYALAFPEHDTRRLHITGVTTRPTRAWTVQQARNLAADLGTRMKFLRFLLRDRDSKYGEAFDAVFEAEKLRVITSAPQAPRMNAHCERIIGSIRREVLDHILIMGEAHTRQVLAAYRMHHNEHRPHQSRDQLPPDAVEHSAAVLDLDTRRRLLPTRTLGGVINEYRYAA